MVIQMTPIEIDDRQARLDWMRAEFRNAQQCRYEKVATALDTAAATPEPTPPPEPPRLVTRSR